jgi:phosphoribosyl-AMP cyclohydrolase / phosphoribosyl-ATP pyrophosphohydrolase
MDETDPRPTASGPIAVDFAKLAAPAPVPLVPAIIQDARTREFLMLGYMDEEALAKTEAEGILTFYSRSKARLWTKGETSGNVLKVVEIRPDCDNDALLILVDPAGPTCHTGTASCFQPQIGDFLARLEETIASRKSAAPEASYTAKLFAKGLPRIAQKVGEEGTETVVAALSGNDRELSAEAADLVFHLLVLLQARGLTLRNVIEVLDQRAKR